jgi:cell wall-associated NlpC family hydrolase
MTLEGFVQAVGTAIGASRDLFGGGVGAGAGLAPMSGPLPSFAGAFSGSGLAASASSDASNAFAAQVSALGVQDLATNSGLQSMQAAAGAGLEQMEAVIGGALGDITGLAAATTTPAGQQALVSALTRRLEQTWQTLTNGNTSACTCAASSAQVAAGYNGLGTPFGGLGTTASMGTMVPLTAMSTMPMMAAGQMAANQSALSGPSMQSSMQQPVSNSNGQSATHVTNTAHHKGIPPKVRTVLNRARSCLGKPYVWGGAGPHGYDCSGLVLHAYSPFISLPHHAASQMLHGMVVARKNIRPGDLIFSNFGEEGSGTGAGHVQMAVGYGANSPIIEAPHTGAVVHIGRIESGRIVIKRLFHWN